MAHERLRPDFLFDEEKIKQLKQIAPECFEDGEINFETLKQNLGDWVVEDDREDVEHFGLFWPGKKEARRIASIPPEGTLEPVYGEGLKPHGTPDDDGQNDSKNIFIEGENLEVLKILQKSYANKIKMIYIDPPYNTGNDFVYDDNYTEPVREYLRRTGQIDEEGQALTTNKKSDGRFHSKWLSMMYPRLRLAKNLLTEDGAIFINIDDNEIEHLKCLMNEIFGEENFIANVAWKHTEQSKNDEKYFSRHYNYLLIYRKSDELEKFRFPRTDEDNRNYSNPDNDPKGDWRSGDVRSPNFRRTLCYDLITPSGKKITPPENGWRWKEETIREKIETGEIIFNKDESSITRKIYLSDQEGRTPENFWQGELYGTTREANSEIKELFAGVVVFDTPKPTKLIKRIMQLFYGEDDYYVLDFFSGSGTTADAVVRLNDEDSGNRSFICIQFPEELDEKAEGRKLGFENISQIARDRIKRAINRVEKITGFKVFRLKDSQFMEWLDYKGTDLIKLQSSLDIFVDSPLKDNWSNDSLLTEILLLEGFELHADTNILQGFKNNIYEVKSSFVKRELLISLDQKIEDETIKELSIKENQVFICFDKSISSENKLKLSDKGLIKTI